MWELNEKTISPSSLDKIVPLQNENGLTYNRCPEFAFRQPFVTAVEEATLLGPDPIALTQTGHVVPEVVHMTNQRRTPRAVTSAVLNSPVAVTKAKFGRASLENSLRSIECAAVLQSRWNNYYHWTLEHLPKLRGVARYQQETGDSVTLVIPRNPPEFVTESLELFGYDEDIIEWDGRQTHVETLVVPSFPELLPRTLGWLRTRAFDAVPPATDTPDWIYLSRERAKKRRVVNKSELESVLAKHSVKIVHLERLSLLEEIALLRSVSGVIGPHGAGLTALLWGEDLSVIELFNDVVKAPYYILSTVLNHKYTALSGRPVDSRPTERNRDFMINPSDLDELLCELDDSNRK
jgi:capsular polysaccharide biosynthesis protein